ncbi:MAG TPA: hypothetical protein ENG44_00885 [Desulfurococcaceae archaeon]|nr:hypothetical protein [Desulfurococcaceae archaeon]
MLLSTSSSTAILSASWIGAFLVTYGIAIAIFMLLERTSTDSEYQGILTIILLFVMTGLVIVSYGIDLHRIIGAVSLSLATRRAFTLLINKLAQLVKM